MEGPYPGGGSWPPRAAAVLAVVLLSLPFLTHADTPRLLINEIMWDGTEYLELKNTTDHPVELTGWSLTRQQAGGETKNIVTFDEDDRVFPQGYFVLEKNEEATTLPADKIVSGLTLVNAGELVQLLSADGTVVDRVNQLGAWFAGENTEAGVAMERTTSDDGTQATSWHTSTATNHGRAGTPGLANSVPQPNAAPEAVISGPGTSVPKTNVTFTAEDASDSDGDTLTYNWSLGDGTSGSGLEVTHAYASAGSFTVRLTVSDGELEDETTHAVVVTAPVYSDQIVINELLPNPVGTDTTSEFIELKNTGTTSVDLGGWQLDDEAGGSTPYTLPAPTTIAAGSLKLYLRSESKLALNNDGDSVRLLDPTGTVRASVTYTGSFAEGVSYNLPPGVLATPAAYVVSTTSTPGAANVITEPEEEEEAEDNEDDSETTTTKNRTGRVAGTAATTIALADVREEEAGTLVQTEGVVSVPPGILGKNIFYLAGSGIQVYAAKGDFPALKLGDRIKITGELSSNRGEARLKLASATDVSPLAAGGPPLPHQVKTGDIDEELEGSLVIVQGEVTETSGDTFYLDDGSGEVKIVIGEATKIDKPKMKKGTAVTITGIVSETTSGYRVLPRFQEDVRLGLVAGLTSFPATGEPRSSKRPVTLSVVLALLIAGAALYLGRKNREPMWGISELAE